MITQIFRPMTQINNPTQFHYDPYMIDLVVLKATMCCIGDLSTQKGRIGLKNIPKTNPTRPMHTWIYICQHQ